MSHYFNEGFDDYDPPIWVIGNLEDYSYHNDAAAKWVLTDDLADEEAPSVVVWVQHPDPSQREQHQDARFALDVLPTGEVNYIPVDSMSRSMDSLAELTEAVVRGAVYLGLKKIPEPVERLQVTLWRGAGREPNRDQLWPGPYSQGITPSTQVQGVRNDLDIPSGDLDDFFVELHPDLGLDQDDLDELRRALSGGKVGEALTRTILSGNDTQGDPLVLERLVEKDTTPARVRDALDAINRSRARSGERALDPVAAGWTDDDVVLEAARMKANPMSAAERKVLGAVLRANAQGRRAPRTKRNAGDMGALERAGHLVVNPTGAWVTGETARRISRGEL